MAVASPVATLGAGVVFGLALAAPPGPMNAVIAEESVLRGWLAGFTAGLGAMLADACFFVLALVGVVTVVREAPTLRAVMVLAGGALMLYFAVGAAASTREALAGDAATDDVVTGRGFRKAFVLALTNPYQIAFWLTVGVGLLDPGTVDVLAKTPYLEGALAGVLVVETGSALLLAGLFGGIACWIVGFPAALVAAGRRVDRLTPLVAGASAVVLAGTGVLFVADGLRGLF
ncbi:LysE family transporter [Halorientalis halophila]|uniref:LysE family transporter n=1 Tax=Halorientalis halophila TaxID=3108499 RepID=UPI00300B7627